MGKFEERIAKAKPPPPPPPPKPPMGPPPPPRIAKAKESIVALPRERVPQKQCPRTGPPPPQRSATTTMSATLATWSTGPPPPGPPPPPRIAKAKESGVDTTWYDTATRKRSATTTRVRVPQMYPGPPTGHHHHSTRVHLVCHHHGGRLGRRRVHHCRSPTPHGTSTTVRLSTESFFCFVLQGRRCPHLTTGALPPST